MHSKEFKMAFFFKYESLDKNLFSIAACIYLLFLRVTLTTYAHPEASHPEVERFYLVKRSSHFRTSISWYSDFSSKQSQRVGLMVT